METPIFFRYKIYFFQLYFFSQKFTNKLFILSFRQLKGLSESRKKIKGFPFKKSIDDVITRKQMTASKFLWY
jgi:hypothetical protein